MNLIQDLLTENRYWTFWSSDWSIRVNIFWEGKTKWNVVVQTVKNKMLSENPGKLQAIHSIMYERQVELKQPDLSFK